MARDKLLDDTPEKTQTTANKGIIETLFDKLALTLYGSERGNDVDPMNDRFNEIIQDQLNKVTDNGENSMRSFLGKLYSDDKDVRKELGELGILDQFQINSVGANPQDFFTEQYKNRMTKQAMAQEISDQLIELRHAKSIMCDVVNSADATTGQIMRTLNFKSSTVSEPEKDWIPIIEAMEEKFGTLDKIKNFITPNTLGYGEYYVYTVPYYHIFNDFIRRYRKSNMTLGGSTTRSFYESADDDILVEKIDILPLFEEAYDENPKPEKPRYGIHEEDKFYLEEELGIISRIVPMEDDGAVATAKDDLNRLFKERITISTGEIPVPILEDGYEAYKDFCDEFITEDGQFMEEGRSKTPVQKKKRAKEKVMMTDEEVYLRKYGENESGFYSTSENDDEMLTEDDIMDCYVKLIPPTRMLPIKMMGRTLFYIYVQTSPATSLSTILSYNTQLKTKDPNNKMDQLLDDIAERVVKKFNKAYIKKNEEFKKQIVAALEYYDISNTNIHFQVIPADYITEYKVNVDVDGNGHSMLEPSLFYANCYLTLLIFKIMTILTKSNDRTVNYVRRSGLDKNLWNDIQDVIRRKNSRKVVLNDIFSFRNVINKVGSGSEEYIGMTRDGNKPIESEIISGQEVQLDTPIMERLHQDMILSTEVPSAIMNFLNEADFAKSIETANTKMNASACSYQICMNRGHTDWYQKLMRFSTKIPPEIIRSFSFTLPEPKGSANLSSQELINNYTTLQEFMLKLFAGENSDDEDRKMRFLKEIAKIYLPGLNITRIQQVWDDTELESAENRIGKADDDGGMEGF